MNEIMKAFYASGIIYRDGERKVTGFRGDEDITDVMDKLESKIESILGEEISNALWNYQAEEDLT